VDPSTQQGFSRVEGLTSRMPHGRHLAEPAGNAVPTRADLAGVQNGDPLHTNSPNIPAILTWAVTPAGQTMRGRRLYGWRLPAMREREPVGELLRGFVRGLPVERHHGGRHARGAKELRAPAVADGRHLDQVWAPANGLFEAMCNQGAIRRCLSGGTGVDLTRHAVQIKRKATRRERAQCNGDDPARHLFEKIFVTAGSQQDLHVSSTVFPHAG